MLEAARRSPMHASHLHFMVTAPGYRRLIMHIFARNDQYLSSDAVFGVKDSLIKDFRRHSAGETAPDGTVPGRPWSDVTFDIVLPVERA
jgi:hydroxyquinol 1,2-dioxygenase